MMRIGGIVSVIMLAVVAVSMAQSTDQLFDGAFAYHRMCSDCHEASGEGVTLFGPPLAGDAFITASGDDAIAYVINNGRKYRDKMYPAYSGMPKFQFITGGELQALIDHLKGPLQKPAKQGSPGK